MSTNNWNSNRPNKTVPGQARLSLQYSKAPQRVMPLYSQNRYDFGLFPLASLIFPWCTRYSHLEVLAVHGESLFIHNDFSTHLPSQATIGCTSWQPLFLVDRELRYWWDHNLDIFFLIGPYSKKKRLTYGLSMLLPLNGKKSCMDFKTQFEVPW